MNIPEFWQIFASSLAENLITILQARDGLSAQSQSSPVQGPEGCSYNSHGSSMQESPSERQSWIYNAVIMWCFFFFFNLTVFPTCYLYTDGESFLCLSSFPVAAADYLSTLSMSSTSLGSDCELTGLDSVLWSSAVELRRGDTKGMLLKVQPLPQSM